MISMCCQLWDHTVVLPLPLLPRGWEICTVTVNISRCGWSLSSFYCWNMVRSVVSWRGVSNGRTPKLFFNPIFLSVLQLAHPSPYTPSAVSMVCLPNESIPTQSWNLWKNSPASLLGALESAACLRSEGSVAAWSISETIMSQISPF